MPATVKLKEEFGDDLAVILVESQGSDEEGFMRFAAARKWLGRDLMWTRERPLATGSGGLPSCALLDEEGRVVLVGNPLALHGSIVDEIEASLQRARKGPKGLPKSVSKVRGQRLDGDWAKAEATLAKEQPGAEGEEARMLVDEGAALERQFEARCKRVSWLLENGYPLQAEELAEQLTKGAKGSEAFLPRAQEALAAVGAASDELGAAKALAKLERTLYEDGPDEKLAGRFQKLVEKHAGTKVAGRAAQLARWATP